MKLARAILDAKTQAGVRLPGNSEGTMTYSFHASATLSIDYDPQTQLVTMRTPQGSRACFVGRFAELEPLATPEAKK